MSKPDQYYINFLQSSQVPIAALSWFKYNSGSQGAVKVTILPGKVLLDWIEEGEADCLIRDYIHRCDFNQQVIAVFADNSIYKFTPDLSPLQAYKLIKSRSDEFMIISSSL